MENGTKLRLLYLYTYLMENSDAEHPVSTPQLIQYLKENFDMDVHRTTLPDDFEMLEKAGIHFGVIRSRQNKYYYDGWLFSIPELKVLIDAVASSKFITEKQSRELIRKLTTLTSKYGADRLRRHVIVDGRAKPDNEKAFHILDAVNRAIDEGCKIRFQYTEYSNKKRRVLKNDGEHYIVSPYALVWDGDYYYMIGYCDNRESMRTFRLDRIYKQPMLLDQEMEEMPEDFRLSDHLAKVFRMYDSEETVEVDLLCEAELMKGVVDRFGIKVKTEAVGEDQFIAHVTVCPSPTFYSWVFGWQGKMKILGPESVADGYRKMLKSALEA